MSTPIPKSLTPPIHKRSSSPVVINEKIGLRAPSYLLLAALFALCLSWGLLTATAQAQTSATYTVQPGDTLGEIAQRFGIGLDALAAANNIDDVNLISVGQVLLIPDEQGQTQLPSVPARPGDTLSTIAVRYNVSVTQLSALNQISTASRFFPGQPVHLPPAALNSPPLRFGAIRNVHLATPLIQGKTAWLTVQSSRPISLHVVWNGLPLAVGPMGDPLVQSAHVPVPALLGPGTFELQLAYQARNGVTVTRTLPVAVAEGDYIEQVITLPPDKGALLDPEIVQAELRKLMAIWTETETPIQWQAAFVRPISTAYSTTSPYGTRRSYNGGPFSSYHAGQDFGAPAGVTVTAPADGIVALAEPLNVRGNAVVLDHGRGVFTGYWHLSQINVEPGQQVHVGDPLGLVGTTGLSTGAHLHWELRIDGISVDPLQFLEEPLFPATPP